jgi:hypothetical protein
VKCIQRQEFVAAAVAAVGDSPYEPPAFILRINRSEQHITLARASFMIERRYFLLSSILLSACASTFGDSSSPAGSIASVGNGSFALAPGEMRSIQIGGFYREFRVCNDTGSSGTLEAIVSNQPPIQLAPGVCWREYGDSLTVRNVSSIAVTGRTSS